MTTIRTLSLKTMKSTVAPAGLISAEKILPLGQGYNNCPAWEWTTTFRCIVFPKLSVKGCETFELVKGSIELLSSLLKEVHAMDGELFVLVCRPRHIERLHPVVIRNLHHIGQGK